MTPVIPVSGSTRLVTLIGNPVAHSLSPLIHNTAFDALGLDFIYTALAVPPARLTDAVRGLAALGVVGANVTVPFKQQVHDIIDETSEQAKLIGAVNTLVFDQSGDNTRITGDNTDIDGFLASLELYRPTLTGTTALVFGAGGAARAVSYAILTAFKPESLTLIVRDIERGLVAAGVLKHVRGDTDLAVIPFEDAHDYVSNSRLIVNATPVGMEPNLAQTPWNEVANFHSGQLVYDLIYAPSETRLMREAAARGAETKNGLDMLVMQAAASFYQWTGVDMPVDLVTRRIHEHLLASSGTS